MHSEAVRENIFETVNNKRHFIKKNEVRSAKKREWVKRKRRSRRAKRKKRNKGK